MPQQRDGQASADQPSHASTQVVKWQPRGYDPEAHAERMRRPKPEGPPRPAPPAPPSFTPSRPYLRPQQPRQLRTQHAQHWSQPSWATHPSARMVPQQPTYARRAVTPGRPGAGAGILHRIMTFLGQRA
jgi:hypothetical protein